MGKLTSPALGEVSGMIPSERYPSSILGTNDSGDDARIYLVDSLANSDRNGKASREYKGWI